MNLQVSMEELKDRKVNKKLKIRNIKIKMKKQHYLLIKILKNTRSPMGSLNHSETCVATITIPRNRTLKLQN